MDRERPKALRHVTSRTTPVACSTRNSAVAVCGATLSFAASTFGTQRVPQR